MANNKKTIFQKSQKGQHAYSLPKNDASFSQFNPPEYLQRKDPLPLPEISEIDLTRHFSKLAQCNMSIDTNFYPLGSCTMKLNPRINEQSASLLKFTRTHPLAPDEYVLGNLELIDELIKMLCEICGMTAGSLLPNAGAQGEYVGLRMISAYHHHNGDFQRNEILVPDSAHGTNPATVSLAGMKAIPVRSNDQGDLDLTDLKSKCSNRTAGLMLTNPNTFGLFSQTVQETTQMVHEYGGLLYYDGANLNAILNITKPGMMGFDVMHLNLHKTFSTPHGGGGPGSGPVLCKEILKPYLPVPRVEKMSDGGYQTIWKDPITIGQIASFHGNFAIYLRAYLYAKLHGHYGLRRIAEQAVINANYLKSKLTTPSFTVPFKQYCMHEFVLQFDRFLDKGVRAMDVAKRLLDYGIHAPTVYFPLVLKETLLIEPTESESKATLDQFIETMEQIVREIKENPEIVKTAPHTLTVARLNEVEAAKTPILIDQNVYDKTTALKRE